MKISILLFICAISLNVSNASERTRDRKEYSYDTPEYRELCRGEISLPENIQKDLKCRYANLGNPFLKIAPFKEEEVHLDPRIVVYYDVINDDEIETLKRLSEPRLESAKVRNETTGIIQSSDLRVAKSVYLEDNGNEHMLRLRRRVDQMSGLIFETSKKFQVAYYDVGGFYAPHYDFVSKADTKSLKDFGTGNRIATVLFYMNTVPEGGTTVFPILNITVWPKKGSAVFWHNLKRNGEGEAETMHGACPVFSGEKWIVTGWLHEQAQVFRRPCTLLEDE